MEEENWEYRDKKGRRNPPVVTITFLMINIVVFIVLSIHGSTTDSYYMMDHGTLVPKLVVEQGEYYRIVTAFFLHFGIAHLFNNMLLMGYLGVRLEQYLGHVKFAMLYLLTGIAGNVFSLIYYLSREPYASCAGASGAVFGIVGAMLWLVIKHRGHLEGLTTRQLLLMILFTLYNGVTGTGINNVAHVAGLISGILLCMVFTHHKKEKDPEYSGFAEGE
jgi:rhomboid protease GluP